MPAWIIIIIVLILLALSGGNKETRDAAEQTQAAGEKAAEVERQSQEIVSACRNQAYDKSRCDDMETARHERVVRE